MSSQYRWIRVGLIGLLGLVCLSAACAQPPIRVGLYNSKPLAFMDEAGHARGVFVDVLNHIAHQQHWTMIYVPGSLDECAHRLLAGDIDLLVNIAQSPERERFWDFSAEYLMLDWASVFTLPGSSIRTIFDLQDKTVSVLKNAITTVEFEKLLEQFGISCRLIVKTENTETLQALHTGEAEAAVSLNLYATVLAENDRIERTAIVFAPLKLGFAARKQSHTDLLATLDREIARLKAERGSAYYDALDVWIGAERKVRVPQWLWWLGLILLGLPLLLLLFILTLNNRISARTATLRATNIRLSSEIEERKRVEAALRESEARLQKVLEILPVGVWIADRHGTIVHGNPAGQQIWSGARYVGPEQFHEYKAWWLATGELVQPEEWGIARAIARGGSSFEEELEIECFDGTHKIILNWAAPIWGPDHAIAGAIAVNQDITDRKQTEASLRINTERYRKAQAMGHVGNWEYNLQTGHFWGSDEAKRIYGFDPEKADFSTDDVEKCILERERVHQALLDLIEANKPYRLEFEIHPKDGSPPRIITSIAELLCDEHGKPVRVAGVIQDITDRKRMEDALRESEERFRFVLENSLDAAYRRNLQTDRYDYMSPVIERVLGWPADEMSTMDTQTVLSLMHPDDVPGILEELERTTALCQTAGRATGMLEYRLRDQRGAYRWVGDPITVLADAEGRPLYRLGIVRDITERKRAEEQLKNQNILLEQAVQQKQRDMEALFERLLRQEKLATIGQMAGSIAHELRNPLGAVKQSVYYLKRLAQAQTLTPSNPKVRHHLDLMDAELNTAERVIADLLDMTRLNPPHCQSTDLRAILTDALAHSPLPPQVHVSLALEPEPLCVYADPFQLRQVLLNVLTNAAHALNGEGTVTIRAKQLTENQDCVITISDTGVGIPPEALANVFEPLYTTKANGTGLGLCICKQIIDSHQGRISLTSQPGEGTTVTIVLPRPT